MFEEKDFPEGVPAPGGGYFAGPGGMAPAFAPGGPLDPISPVLTEEYFQQVQEGAIQQGAFQPGFIGSGAPGDPMLGAGAPMTSAQNYPANVLAGVGGSGAGSTTIPVPSSQGIQGLPGHGTTPGRFQPGGGVHLPTAGQLPTQRPGRERDPGFLARIVPVSGDVSRIIPVSGGAPNIPGQPLPGEPPTVGGGPMPQPPGIGGGPIIPPYPGGPPTVGGGPIIPPSEGGGPSQGKPKGLKTLPPPAGATPPTGPPKPPGQWVTLDAGRGAPPAWAFIEATGPGTDDGLEGTPTPKPTAGKPTPPMAGGGTGGEKGHYVPVQMPYVVEPYAEREDADDVVWAWVPTIDDSYGVKAPEPPSTPQPK